MSLSNFSTFEAQSTSCCKESEGTKTMGKIEVSMWANEQGIVSSVVLILGGCIAVAGQFKNWEIAAYALALGILILIVEYPRGKRQKGTTVQRKFQGVFSVVVQQGRLVTRNYFFRFLVYILASIPCCLVLSTFVGAMSLIITSVIYLVAAIRGEEWTPIPQVKDQQGPQVINEPSRPPPRRPDTAPNSVGENRV